MAGVRGAAILVALVLACIAGSPVVKGSLPGYSDYPTVSYGPEPPCIVDNVQQDCSWYGYIYTLYPTQGAVCLTGTRAFLSNTSLEGSLDPGVYYYIPQYVFDPSTNATYCVIGCFNVSASGLDLAPPPPSTLAPSSAPPTSTPPPTLKSSPPPGLSAPPTESPPSLDPSPPSPPPPSGTPKIFNIGGAGFLQPTGFLSFMISAALLIFNGLVAS